METAKDGMVLAARQKKGMAREARIIMNVVRGVGDKQEWRRSRLIGGNQYLKNEIGGQESMVVYRCHGHWVILGLYTVRPVLAISCQCVTVMSCDGNA